MKYNKQTQQFEYKDIEAFDLDGQLLFPLKRNNYYTEELTKREDFTSYSKDGQK